MKKNQDSLSINVLNNIKIDDEIQIIVERNGLRVKDLKVTFILYLVTYPSQFCLKIVMIPRTVIQ